MIPLAVDRWAEQGGEPSFFMGKGSAKAENRRKEISLTLLKQTHCPADKNAKEPLFL
jgi:hypothetical protein